MHVGASARADNCETLCATDRRILRASFSGSDGIGRTADIRSRQIPQALPARSPVPWCAPVERPAQAKQALMVAEDSRSVTRCSLKKIVLSTRLSQAPHRAR